MPRVEDGLPPTVRESHQQLVVVGVRSLSAANSPRYRAGSGSDVRIRRVTCPPDRRASLLTPFAFVRAARFCRRGDVDTGWMHVIAGGDVQAVDVGGESHINTNANPVLFDPLQKCSHSSVLVRQRLFDIGPVDGRPCRHVPERNSPPALPIAIAAST